MHIFPNYQQKGHVFLARGQALTVCSPHWSQRYIRAVIKHFLNTNAFIQVMNFPTYILTHALPVLFLYSHSLVHSMNYLPDLTWVGILAGCWLHNLREFCQVGNINDLASNPSPLGLLRTMGIPELPCCPFLVPKYMVLFWTTISGFIVFGSRFLASLWPL